MAQYIMNNTFGGTQQALTSTAKTLTAVVGAATCRVRVWDVNVGASGTYNATDCSIRYDVATKDASTAGTATAITSANTPPLNPADAVALASGNVNYTAEPTVYLSKLPLELNQRASQRWNATSADQCIVIAATASFTVGVRASSGTYVGTATATLIFDQG
jgi:hypothetical protein